MSVGERTIQGCDVIECQLVGGCLKLNKVKTGDGFVGIRFLAFRTVVHIQNLINLFLEDTSVGGKSRYL